MKNKLSLAGLALCALLLSTAPAAAAGDTGVYLGTKAALGFFKLSSMEGHRGGATQSFSDGDYQTTWAWNINGGYNLYNQYGAPVRLEAELMHVGETSTHGTAGGAFGTGVDYSQKASVNVLFVNAYLDFHNSSAFTPYVGAGVGPSWVSSKGSVGGVGTSSNTETNLAWHIGFGAAVALSHNIELDFGYRYASFGTAQTDLGPSNAYLESDAAMHQIMAGVRYSF